MDYQEESSNSTDPQYFQEDSSNSTGPQYFEEDSSPSTGPQYLEEDSSHSTGPQYFQEDSSPSAGPQYFQEDSSHSTGLPFLEAMESEEPPSSCLEGPWKMFDDEPSCSFSHIMNEQNQPSSSRVNTHENLRTDEPPISWEEFLPFIKTEKDDIALPVTEKIESDASSHEEELSLQRENDAETERNLSLDRNDKEALTLPVVIKTEVMKVPNTSTFDICDDMEAAENQDILFAGKHKRNVPPPRQIVPDQEVEDLKEFCSERNLVVDKVARGIKKEKLDDYHSNCKKPHLDEDPEKSDASKDVPKDISKDVPLEESKDGERKRKFTKKVIFAISEDEEKSEESKDVPMDDVPLEVSKDVPLEVSKDAKRKRKFTKKEKLAISEEKPAAAAADEGYGIRGAAASKIDGDFAHHEQSSANSEGESILQDGFDSIITEGGLFQPHSVPFHSTNNEQASSNLIDESSLLDVNDHIITKIGMQSVTDNSQEKPSEPAKKRRKRNKAENNNKQASVRFDDENFQIEVDKLRNKIKALGASDNIQDQSMSLKTSEDVIQNLLQYKLRARRVQTSKGMATVKSGGTEEDGTSQENMIKSMKNCCVVLKRLEQMNFPKSRSSHHDNNLECHEILKMQQCFVQLEDIGNTHVNDLAGASESVLDNTEPLLSDHDSEDVEIMVRQFKQDMLKKLPPCRNKKDALQRVLMPIYLINSVLEGDNLTLDLDLEDNPPQEIENILWDAFTKIFVSYFVKL